jgi:hypothetical protein
MDGGVAGLVAFLNPAGRTAVLPFNTWRTGLVRTSSQPLDGIVFALQVSTFGER